MAEVQRKNKLKDGTKVPGATSIVKILNQPFLVKWANKLGKQGIDVDEYVKDTAKIGTLIHAMVESHVMHKEIIIGEEYTDQDIERAEVGLRKYLEWEKSHIIEPIFLEEGFVSELYKFCGVIDFFCILDGKYTIVDFKTSKGITREHFLQVSSYVQLLIEHGYKVDQIMILNIPRDDTIEFKTEYMQLDSAAYYWEMFKQLINVYYIKKQLGWKD